MPLRFAFGAAYSAFILGLAVPAAATAQAGSSEAAAASVLADPNSEDIALAQDRRDRMTVPITIAGQGPYQFLIDTGAERTVISAELARELSLAEGSRMRLHSMSGVGEVGTAIIPSLQISRTSVSRIHAPALKEVHLGARGILGIDTLQRQRVTFDFERQKMTVTPSRLHEAEGDEDEIVVTAKRRLGRLVLVDARLDGEKLMVVLDTGSEVTVGNLALRKKLEAKRKIGPTVPIQLVSVTGGEVRADYTQAKQVRIGGMLINDLPVAFAEVHVFKQLELSDRPALLLGMDALRLFNKVSVDFANRKVHFAAPEFSAFDWASGSALAAR